MAKNSKTPKNHEIHDEEYKFSEAEHEPLLEPTQPPRQSKFKALLRNRRLLLIIGVIIAVLIVYQFIGQSPKVKEEVGELESKQPLPPLSPALPAVTAPSMPSTSPVLATTPSSMLDAESMARQNQAQLQQIQANLQQLQGSVSQLGSQVASLTNAVGSASSSQKACAIPAMPVKATTIVKARKKASSPRAIYSVRAVVPGQAWLQEKKNRHITRLITVKVGDFLPGYGRIQAINSGQGKVYTSWGNVINYDNVTD